MRILMVSDFYPPYVGGVEVMVSSLARGLARRGHEVTVATLAVPDLPVSESDSGVSVRRIRSTAQRASGIYASEARPWAPPAPDPEAVAGLRSVVAKARPQVVHGHDWLARSYLPLKRRGSAALVMSLHYFTLSCPKKNLMYDGTPCSGPALTKCLGCAGRHYGRAKGLAVVASHRVFSRVEAALADLFLPVSQATAVGNGLPGSGLPYDVIPNLVAPAGDPPGSSEVLDELPAEPFLLFVGDLRRDKGIDVLLEAHARMAAPPRLVLIGKVWPESPALPDGVVLLRNWPNAAVREAMRRCLALVVPSVWPEPFGMVVVEALAAGRPVMASAVGGIPEIVRDRREGLLVPPADSGALAAALSTVCDDHDERERLAANALERATAYSADAILPRFEAAYERALRGRSSRA